jgi:hypothetical protein
VIEIVIDELVVRGLPASAAREAAAALESRLGALARAGASIAAREEAFRRLDPVAVPAGSPHALGEGVAGAVWGALSGGGR